MKKSSVAAGAAGMLCVIAAGAYLVGAFVTGTGAGGMSAALALGVCGAVAGRWVGKAAGSI